MPTIRKSPKVDQHWCRFYLDLEGKLKAKKRDQVCDIVLAALRKAGPALANAITDVEAITSKEHRFDAEKGKKVKMGHRNKSLYVRASINGTARQVDSILERTIPILKEDLIQAGFEVNQGWGERSVQTNAHMVS